MILEVSYIPNGAGLDRHQQYDLRDRKFESGNWQKYPKIGKTDDVLTLPDVKVTLATTDMPSPKQCMSYIKKRWIPPMKSCLVKRWISMKGYNDPCTNPPHSLQSQDDFVFVGRLEQLPKPARLFCSHTALVPLGEWPASIHFHLTQRNPNVATSTHQKPREILTPPWD